MKIIGDFGSAGNGLENPTVQGDTRSDSTRDSGDFWGDDGRRDEENGSSRVSGNSFNEREITSSGGALRISDRVSSSG